MVQLASHRTFFSSSARMRSSPAVGCGFSVIVVVTCCRPRATDLGLPEIGALSAHIGYSRHALGTHRATYPGLWNMGPRLRGDDSHIARCGIKTLAGYGASSTWRHAAGRSAILG